jgi:hypothetical protein
MYIYDLILKLLIAKTQLTLLNYFIINEIDHKSILTFFPLLLFSLLVLKSSW